MANAQRARQPDLRTLGEIFTAAYEAMNPRPSYGAIASDVSKMIGRRITDNAVILYHRDRVDSPDPILVAAIALIYDLGLDDLPDRERVRCERATMVFTALSTPPGTRTRNLQIRSAA